MSTVKIRRRRSPNGVLWITWLPGGQPVVWLCIGGKKPLGHLPKTHWRRRFPVIRKRLM